jgi:hypothetical protein
MRLHGPPMLVQAMHEGAKDASCHRALPKRLHLEGYCDEVRRGLPFVTACCYFALRSKRSPSAFSLGGCVWRGRSENSVRAILYVPFLYLTPWPAKQQLGRKAQDNFPILPFLVFEILSVE